MFYPPFRIQVILPAPVCLRLFISVYFSIIQHESEPKRFPENGVYFVLYQVLVSSLILIRK